MATATERRYHALMLACREIVGNPGLPGKFADGAMILAFHIASARADRDGAWSRVSHRVVSKEANIQAVQLRILVRAMAEDALIERRQTRLATPQGYRSAVFLRSLVGDGLVDLLRALGCWTPDWRPHTRERVPCAPRSHACPHCGSQDRQIVIACAGCGAVLSERLVHGDGEPPG